MAARAAKQVTKNSPALDFGPPDWLPLNAAFGRLLKLGWSRRLGAAELYRQLKAGRLKSGAIVFPPARQIIVESMAEATRQVLKPEWWQQYKGLTVEGDGVQVWPPYRVQGRWYIFVRRSDLDELYPETVPAEPSKTTKPPSRRSGRPVTHDWHTICGEIARRCIDPKSRRLALPKNEAKLRDDIMEWCATGPLGKEPSVSEMREAIRRVLAPLKEI
jgi:hypothetical protein